MKNVLKLIKKARSIALFGHISVDQDCLGSISALKNALEILNKKVDVFIGDSSYDKSMDFLCEKSWFLNELKSDNYDLFISLDVASPNLLGEYKNDFLQFKNTIVIDHHISNEKYGKINFIDNKTSNCEIVFDLIKKLKVKFTDKMAEGLYAGIVADTQCLSIDTINSNTFSTLAELFKTDFDYSWVLDRVFRVKSSDDIKKQKFLYDNFTVDDGVAYLLVKNKDIKSLKLEKQEFSCSDNINSILNIVGVKIALIVAQMEKQNYKVSLRCKRGYDVNKIASVFGGGGHIQASGAKFCGNAEVNTKKIVELCKSQIKEIDSKR